MFASAMSGSSTSDNRMASTPSGTSDKGMVRESKRPGSAYLLALLTHQASWYTLHRCIDKLLGKARLENK